MNIIVYGFMFVIFKLKTYVHLWITSEFDESMHMGELHEL